MKFWNLLQENVRTLHKHTEDEEVKKQLGIVSAAETCFFVVVIVCF